MSTKNVYGLLAWSGIMITGLSTVIGATETNLKASILGNTYCFLDVDRYYSFDNHRGYCTSVVSLNAILLGYILMTTLFRLYFIASNSSLSIRSAFINFIVSTFATIVTFSVGILFIAGWFKTCDTIRPGLPNTQCDVILMRALNFKINSIYAAVAFSIINFLGMLYLMIIDYRFWQKRKTRNWIT